MPSDTFWSDVTALERRVTAIEERLDVLAKTTPADLITVVEGLKCALTGVERQMRELKAQGREPEETALHENWRGVAHNLRDGWGDGNDAH